MKDRVRDWGEKEIISRILGPLLGEKIGDDCALIDFGDKYLVATTDKTPEKPLAFEAGLMDFYDMGYYLAVSNLSDVASMGARPLGFLASTSFPDDFKVNDLESLVKGIRDGCLAHETSFIGGDTSSSSAISLVGSAFGVVDKDKVLLRNNQSVGDVVFTTGKVGLFSTALLYYLKAKPMGMRLSSLEEGILSKKLLRPEALFKEGELLGESRACTSCMDITDGFAMSAYDLIRANNLGMEIYRKALPIHHVSRKVAKYLGLDVVDLVFGAGADYELFGTVKKDKVNEVYNLFADNGARIYFIGRVVPSEGLYLSELPFYVSNSAKGSEGVFRENNSKLIKPRGWQHFSGDAKDVVLKQFKKDGK